MTITTKPWDYAAVDVDFTQVQRAEVVGCFSGHLHRDALAQVGALHVAVTTCDADLSYDPEEEPRTAGTSAEQAIDLVTLNRRTRTVYFIASFFRPNTRLGPGRDRSFTY